LTKKNATEGSTTAHVRPDLESLAATAITQLPPSLFGAVVCDPQGGLVGLRHTRRPLLPFADQFSSCLHLHWFRVDESDLAPKKANRDVLPSLDVDGDENKHHLLMVVQAKIVDAAWVMLKCGA